MKKIILYITIPFFFCACNNDDSEEIIVDPIPTITYKIMPLGDSRVDGSPTLQGHQSYRYDLWKNLVENDFDFDLIGPETDPINYPLVQNTAFDPHHAGFGGYRASTILERFTDIVDPNNVPDIVLLGIGGNDLTGGVSSSQVIENIHLIIDFFQALNPEVKIIVEQIAPARSFDMTDTEWELLNEFNSAIVILANQQTSGSSEVIPVNMASGWQDSYLYDRVHYSSEGAKEVADRYYNAISSLFD